MELGQIQVTHAQRQYYMGYLIPYLLYASNALGMPAAKALVQDLLVDDTHLDTGLDVVPADGVAAYNAFLDSLGIL